MDKTEFQREVDATVRELPLEPPGDTIAILTQRGILHKEAFVYKVEMASETLTGKKKRMAHLKCTSCGHSEFVEYKDAEYGCTLVPGGEIVFQDPNFGDFKGTGDDCYCPSCGTNVTAVHTSRIKGHCVLASCLCMSVHNVRGHLCLLSWRISKLCDKDARVSYSADRWEGQIFIRKKAVRVSAQKNHFGAQIYFSRWESRKKFVDMLEAFSSRETLPFDENVLFGTDLRHSAFEVYALREGIDRIFPAQYIRFCLKYPQVENLVRQGYSKLVDEIIENATQYVGSYSRHPSFQLQMIKDYINHKAKKPHEMLGIDKDKMDLAKTYSLSTLKMYKYVKERFSVELDSGILNFVETTKSLAGYERLFDEGCNGHIPKPIHLLNYMKRERYAAGVSIISIRYLIDYWDALFLVYGEMVPSLLYPKNLRKAHDDMVARVKHKEDQELNAKIITQSKANEKLCFTDEELGLTIFPAPDHQALINEGKILRHCVAGYAKAVAAGDALILFIRKISEPDIPYFTLEYKQKTVAQNRGFKNCSPPEDVVEFQKKWLKFLKQGGKHGKRSNAKQRAIAGA